MQRVPESERTSLYPDIAEDDWLEFDSVIKLRP